MLNNRYAWERNISENQTCTALRATILCHILPPIRGLSSWGSAEKQWIHRGDRVDIVGLFAEKLTFPMPDKGLILPLQKGCEGDAIRPCVSKQCPADGVWRIGRGVSPDRVRKTRFTPSESSAGHGLPPQRPPKLRACQRSGEGVVRRNGCPKGCFCRVRFFSAPLRFSGPSRCFKSKPSARQRRNGLSKTPLLDNRSSARPLRRSFGAP